MHKNSVEARYRAAVPGTALKLGQPHRLTAIYRRSIIQIAEQLCRAIAS